MTKELADKLKEHFPKFFGGDARIEIDEDTAEIQKNGNVSAYFFSIIDNALKLGSVVGDDITNREFIRGVLKLNETVAREIGLSKVVYDGSVEESKKVALEEGYIFGEKSYLGVKRL